MLSDSDSNVCRTVFRFLPDSNRSEATRWVSDKGVSDRSQDFARVFVRLWSPAEGRRSHGQTQDVLAPLLRAGGERRERTSEPPFAFPPVATRNGLTRPSESARPWLTNFKFHFPKEFCLCAVIRL